MANDKKNRTMILLLDRGESNQEVTGWLNENGFVALRAYDVCHAIEELSDFTVRRRPDVVLLEVTSLPQRFVALTEALNQCQGDVSVCGYAPATVQPAGRFTSDLNQLRSIISRQVRPSNN